MSLLPDNLVKESTPMQCPVCDRQFSKTVIESHVNKCIFLNSKNENNLKRPNRPEENVTSHKLKRVKVDPTSSTTTTKIMPIEKSELNSDMISQNSNQSIPLAELMRPYLIEDIIGHKETFGVGSILHSMFTTNKIPNMILWGPPGCGKTSLGNVIANVCKKESHLRFVKLSATTVGINDVKEVVKVAKNEAQFKRHTVLFMDEIHRFNKLQQDTFLTHVENGTITLVGATTENPSFSLNNALLSRCRVVVLEKLTVEDVECILERAIHKSNIAIIIDKIDDSEELKKNKYFIEKASIKWLAEISDGDARIALGALELVFNSKCDPCQSSVITLEELKSGIKRTHIMYDRKGEEHYNIISAIQKSIRASDDNAALYWTTRALHSGEDPLFIARRLIRTACEDIGLADPNAVVEAVACLHGCQHIGMPESDVLLAQCAVRLARAPKSPEVYHAMKRVQQSLSAAKGPLPTVPLPLRNAPTKLMKELGYAKGYNTRHRNCSGINYMPEGLENVNFFIDSINSDT
ncbi:unnamed protein product [Leptosia nina]|uniref:AAA+ ATPase domain-containing protein n=1 Tax=Leptosia nina TaxID=320188 RepID=A0AAV1JNA6_9NEOP